LMILVFLFHLLLYLQRTFDADIGRIMQSISLTLTAKYAFYEYDYDYFVLYYTGCMMIEKNLF
ncbi:MAG: hypothetical protein ACI8RD_009183, partial [Bacillariaceae sp.]